MRALWTGLGLSLALVGSLLAVGKALERRSLRIAGRTPSYRIERVELGAPLRQGRSARIPKSSAVVLQAGRPELWKGLVRRESSGQQKLLRPVKRLKPGRAGWALVGSGPEAPIPLPRFTRSYRLLTLTATAYDPGPVDNSRGWVGATSTGERARFGIAAVDPAVIPQGSLLYVEGYGPALAADRGGAIKGRRIDLCFNRTREALDWGRRPVKVWLLERVPGKDAAALQAQLFPLPGS
jgi:3D (Asp-Asp-Asp) domain-containing protein